MSNLDHYDCHRSNVSGPLAACPESRLVARLAEADARPFGDRVDELIAHCAFPAGALVLDYGCGAGQETERLAHAVGGRALGVDASLPMIREASATEHTRFTHAPNGVVPTGRHRFDVVHVSLVLGGLRGQNLGRAVSELVRVLKPGGLLVLIDATGDRTSSARWTSRSADTYRGLFPQVALKAEARLERGGDHLMLLAGRREADTSTPVALSPERRLRGTPDQLQSGATPAMGASRARASTASRIASCGVRARAVR